MPHGPELTLNAGATMPRGGLGTYRSDDADGGRVVAEAIAAGYRHIDTAAIYDNEAGVGRGLQASGLAREDLFVTTKLWNTEQGRHEPRAALHASLERLGLDYVDLYLIHWPCPTRDRYVDSWAALEELRDEGLIRTIGVSNFQPEHLERLAENSDPIPAVNQVELHPYFQQGLLRECHSRDGILTESWGPLGQGKYPLDEIPALVEIAQSHGVTIPQVVLAWHLHEGLIVIPKTVSSDRLRENLAAVDIALTEAEMTLIRGLECGQRVGSDPSEVTF